jgi:hypothetical protein
MRVDNCMLKTKGVNWLSCTKDAVLINLSRVSRGNRCRGKKVRRMAFIDLLEKPSG